MCEIIKCIYNRRRCDQLGETKVNIIVKYWNFNLRLLKFWLANFLILMNYLNQLYKRWRYLRTRNFKISTRTISYPTIDTPPNEFIRFVSFNFYL